MDLVGALGSEPDRTDAPPAVALLGRAGVRALVEALGGLQVLPGRPRPVDAPAADAELAVGGGAAGPGERDHLGALVHAHRCREAVGGRCGGAPGGGGRAGEGDRGGLQVAGPGRPGGEGQADEDRPGGQHSWSEQRQAARSGGEGEGHEGALGEADKVDGVLAIG